MRDCDIEFGIDHEHDDVQCAQTLANMNWDMPDERFWEVDEFGQPVYNTDY